MQLHQHQCVLHLAAWWPHASTAFVTCSCRTWEWMQFYSVTPQWSRVGCWQGPLGVSSVMTWQLSLNNWSRGTPPWLYVLTYSVHMCMCVWVPIPSHIYIYIYIYMNTYVIWTYVCVSISVCTCNLQVMRVYLQNLNTYYGDSVVCCKWQTALQQAHICNPTRCRLICFLHFVMEQVHASPGKFRVRYVFGSWVSYFVLSCNHCNVWKPATFTVLSSSFLSQSPFQFRNVIPALQI